MLDTKSLSIALILILIIGCVMHLVNWRMHRASPGAKWWTIGLCSQTLAIVLAAVANSQPDISMPLILLVNYLALGGTVLLVYGTASFAERPLPPVIYAGLAGAIVFGLAWFTLIGPSISLRLILVGLVQLTCNALILTRLGPIAKRDGPMGVVVLAAAVISMMLLLGGLGLWQFLTQPMFTGLYSESPVLPAVMLTLIACKSTMIFGYLLLSTAYSQAQLERMALNDTLTDLPNRRAFEREVSQRLRSTRKHDRLMALAIFDIDHFKLVNDKHGHDGGDDVLRHLGRVAARAVRPKDFVARVGGEEFAVLFDVDDAAELVTAANRLRLAIEIDRPLVGELRLPITVSVGAAMAASSPELDFGALYRAADQSLYQAKATGRNRVVVGEVDGFDLAA
ncbi:GGDEF domain-containing protein [Maricaulis sp.]|uniref:GGDEF domain-containing protein n=1 Tax=Maricaulis sp. TaxID=1486257 RepID=UPI003A916ED8